MKKGFTLIELLAVIVILAIIALIATPIVLSIIDDSKESSTIRSAEGYLRAVEYEIAQAYVTPNRITEGVFNVLSGGNICIDGYENNECTGSVLEIEYNNEGPISGSITLEEAKITHYTLTYPSGITVVDGKVGDEIEQIPEPKSFSEDSWATIAANVRAGNLSKYKVGDTKTIELEGFGTHTVRIANTSTPSKCNNPDFSQTACGFVIEFADIITDYYMNEEETNEGGWEDSDMRSYVNNTILNSFPSDLKDLIIDTKVVSGYNAEWDSSNFVTTDKLYLLATGEICENGEDFIITNDTARDLTRQLDYYNGVTTD